LDGIGSVSRTPAFGSGEIKHRGAVRVKRILFVCGQNKLRSPTAEHVFASWPGVETASAGLKHEAEVPVCPELLAWADVIFVMERSHRAKLAQAFRKHLGGKRVICLEVPDRFSYMQPELVSLLEARVAPHLPAK
jgi:predicted protein tyrosine phosphatase